MEPIATPLSLTPRTSKLDLKLLTGFVAARQQADPLQPTLLGMVVGKKRNGVNGAPNPFLSQSGLVSLFSFICGKVEIIFISVYRMHLLVIKIYQGLGRGHILLSCLGSLFLSI